MGRVRSAGKRPDAAGFSKALNELRSRGYLTDKNIETIQGWIGSIFPSSIRYLARELLKGEESEEKKNLSGTRNIWSGFSSSIRYLAGGLLRRTAEEREEKIPSWDARNICSSSTQNDLTGDPMPRDLSEVVSFLLPRGGKSECLTESDLRTLLRPKADWDQIYLFDPSRPMNNAIVFSPIYRLPSSGIWILGTAPYLRMLKAYQLESFGKHPIGVKVHSRSSIYGEIVELFLAKPLHYDDFKALIVNNTPLPPAPAAYTCLFKPDMNDWSETFRANYPIKDCECLIPTWNGFPVTLGSDYSKVLCWDYTIITLPAATAISIDPEMEEKNEENEENEENKEDEQEDDEENDTESANERATSIIDSYLHVIYRKMFLISRAGTVDTLDQFPIDAYLIVESDEDAVETFYPHDVNTTATRADSIEALAQMLRQTGVSNPDLELRIKWLNPVLDSKIDNVTSESSLFRQPSSTTLHIDWNNPYQIWISDPFY